VDKTIVGKSHSKLESIFFLFALPLLFTMILTGVLLSVLGYDVTGTLKDWGNAIPYVEKIIPDNVVKETPGETDAQDKTQADKVTQMDQSLKEEQAARLELEQQLQTKTAELESLQQQNETLREQLGSLQQTSKEREQQIQALAQMYAKMSPSKAAPILEKLSLAEAVIIIKAMTTEERSTILAKMNPDLAAQMTAELLKAAQ
jgi:flagellar motility protein MotE (MotC chaperone)